MEEIRRDNLREFLLWGFFDLDGDRTGETGSDILEQEMNEFVARIEQGLGRALLSGRGNAQCIRMTFDDIETTYRSLLWYVIMFAIDQIAHCALSWYGFRLYGRPPATELSYYYRPHISADSFPVVFIHGIGIGLWTYVRFLADIHAAGKRGQGGGVGVIAIEILPVSFRLTSPPLGKAEFLRQMTRILDHHGWDKFAVVSHSYGSVPTTHMIQSPTLQRRIVSVVLIDPVTIMLHHPNVAYNFTRRRPKKANEWQLWYFASTDPGVAHCLGRHFFWQENIVWKEELLFRDGNQREGPMMGRRVAVCLAGRDILVDTPSVAKYLTDQMAPYCDGVGSSQEVGVKVIMFPKLDHAQVFDSPPDREKVVQLIQLYCRRE
ncbi:hypothetical protein PT974_06414 [Cladobotryum mycophilum]|uniref:AB hydrolase-1 domain-containing protein n=1 Tax=Cladobotryum mycophilum TaxID=491253 RepID=A0ABR0SLS7_9HYPO